MNTRKMLLVLVLSACCGLTLAQSSTLTEYVGQTTTFTWGAPTTFTDGTTIPSTDTITYNIYTTSLPAGSSCPGTSSTPTETTGLTAETYTTPAYATAGVYCYAATAVVNGSESAQTPQVQVDVLNPQPNPPSGFTGK